MRGQRFLCAVCEATKLAKQTTTQSPHKTYYVIVKVLAVALNSGVFRNNIVVCHNKAGLSSRVLCSKTAS